MTVTLEPELERELSHKAEEQGQDAETYVSQLIKEALRQPVPTIIRSRLTPAEIEQLHQERMERALARDLPASTSDFRREDIYDDSEGL